MFGIGKLIALPVRLANAPIRAGEKFMAHLVGEKDIQPGNRIVSLPLESLAKALEEIDGE